MEWVARASQVTLVVKNPPTSAGDTIPLGQEDALEEEMAWFLGTMKEQVKYPGLSNSEEARHTVRLGERMLLPELGQGWRGGRGAV